MKPMTFKRSRFKLKIFLDALHRFSVQNLGNGNPLPVLSGETVHLDPIDLAEALAADGQDEIEVPDDSLGRLEAGLTLYGQFAGFDGFDGFDCADGQHVDVPCLDEDEDCDEPAMPRRRLNEFGLLIKKLMVEVPPKGTLVGEKLLLMVGTS